MSNPLQKYYRQPKIFIKLPSGGVFNEPGTIQGDVNKLAVYGMTGMDEIILKTPDALLAGESTARVIESCCQNIKNAWDLSSLDTPMILAAIRIASYGNTMTVGHKCTKCGAEHDYDLDLGKIVEFYNNCAFDNRVEVGNLVVRLRPLTYKQSNEFSMRNFQLKQRSKQLDEITDDQQRQTILKQLFDDMAVIQNDIFIATVEAVETSETVVTNSVHIQEWLKNCDADVFEAIKKKNSDNRDVWAMPLFPVTCSECGAETNLSIDLDHASFFERA